MLGTVLQLYVLNADTLAVTGGCIAYVLSPTMCIVRAQTEFKDCYQQLQLESF